MLRLCEQTPPFGWQRCWPSRWPHSSRRRSRPRATRPAKMEQVLVGRASVIDGDTLEEHGRRIRLAAIDAPESRQSCRQARTIVAVRPPRRLRAGRPDRRAAGDVPLAWARPLSARGRLLRGRQGRSRWLDGRAGPCAGVPQVRHGLYPARGRRPRRAAGSVGWVVRPAMGLARRPRRRGFRAYLRWQLAATASACSRVARPLAAAWRSANAPYILAAQRLDGNRGMLAKASPWLGRKYFLDKMSHQRSRRRLLHALLDTDLHPAGSGGVGICRKLRAELA